MKSLLLRILLVAILLVVSVWFAKCQYDECRAMGFGRFYCVKHAW